MKRFLLLCAVASTACIPPFRDVEVSSELPVEAAFLRVRVCGAEGGVFDRTWPVPDERMLPETLQLSPVGGDADREGTVLAEIYDARGELLGQQRQRVGFRDNTPDLQQIVFTEACQGVRCGDAEFCIEGECQALDRALPCESVTDECSECPSNRCDVVCSICIEGPMCGLVAQWPFAGDTDNVVSDGPAFDSGGMGMQEADHYAFADPATGFRASFDSADAGEFTISLRFQTDRLNYLPCDGRDCIDRYLFWMSEGSDFIGIQLADQGAIRVKANVGEVTIGDTTETSLTHSGFDESWTHVAITIRNRFRHWELYVDGLAVARAEVGGDSGGFSPVEVGVGAPPLMGSSSDHGLDAGSLRDVRVFGRALRPEEVAALAAE